MNYSAKYLGSKVVIHTRTHTQTHNRPVALYTITKVVGNKKRINIE